MSPRNRHYGGSPSPHDSTGPRSKGDIARPLGAPPPDNPGIKGKASKGCALVLLALPGAVLALALVGHFT